jgi:multiple antibiotic resistance protein
MSGLSREMLLLGVSLLTLFNPPSAMAAFASLAVPYPLEIQKRMVRRTVVLYAIAIFLVTWVGRPLLRLLGVSLPALRLGGGFVLLLAAIRMVTDYQRAGTEMERERPVSSHWSQVVAVPLTFPISIGGATVAAIVAASGDQVSPHRALATSLVCLIMTALVWLTLRAAIPLTQRLSRGALVGLTAVSGLLLVCVAFQVMASGLRELLPGLNGR